MQRTHVVGKSVPRRILDASALEAERSRAPELAMSIDTPKKHTFLSLGLLVMIGWSWGCVKVAPYERGQLAHPTMAVTDMSAGLDGHVRGVSEGASGGLGGGGGGCGCN